MQSAGTYISNINLNSKLSALHRFYLASAIVKFWGVTGTASRAPKLCSFLRSTLWKPMRTARRCKKNQIFNLVETIFNPSEKQYFDKRTKSSDICLDNGQCQARRLRDRFVRAKYRTASGHDFPSKSSPLNGSCGSSKPGWIHLRQNYFWRRYMSPSSSTMSHDQADDHTLSEMVSAIESKQSELKLLEQSYSIKLIRANSQKKS